MSRDKAGESAASVEDYAAALRGRIVHIRLDGEDLGRLVRVADARRMRPNKLAMRLLRIVLQDNLIDAVMDDDGNHAGGDRKRPRRNLAASMRRS